MGRAWTILWKKFSASQDKGGTALGIIKRDGRIVPIDESRIADAVKRAAIYGCNMSDDTAIKNLCNRVVHAVEETFDFTKMSALRIFRTRLRRL